MIPKNTPKQETLGVRLLKYLVSPQNSLFWAENNGEVAAYQSVAQQLIKAVPLDRVFASEIEHARSRVSFVGAAYPAISAALATAIEEACLGKASPTQALDTAQKAVEAALAQAKA